MIKSIRLQNFFSFKDQKIEFGSTNFLVGINGVGKSNLIKAFRLLKATLTKGELEELIINKWGGFDAIYFKGSELDEESSCSITFEFDTNVLNEYGYSFSDAVFYRIDIEKISSTQNFNIDEVCFVENEDATRGRVLFSSKYGKGFTFEGFGTKHEVKVEYIFDTISDSVLCQLMDSNRYPQISAIRKAIADIAIYNYFNTTENSPIRKPAATTSATKLVADGSNLPQLLNWININHKKDYKAIKSSLNAINPNITDIDFHPLGTNVELLLEEEEFNSSVHVAHVSDGTLRYLCLMAIVHNPKRGRFICIDEPEVGLHPDMICEFMEAMEEASDTTQFLVSTHSELVLNQTTVDNVIVCEKDDANATCVKTFRTEEYKEWAADYSTGNLWRNGDLGGNRY